MAFVTVASDRALQGADDAIAHILPKLRLRKVISGKQSCNCLFLFEFPFGIKTLVSSRSHLVDVYIVYYILCYYYYYNITIIIIFSKVKQFSQL